MTQKKGKATGETGGLREDGHGQIRRGHERERDGCGQHAMERMDEQIGPAILGVTLTLTVTLTPVQQGVRIYIYTYILYIIYIYIYIYIYI